MSIFHLYTVFNTDYLLIKRVLCNVLPHLINPQNGQIIFWIIKESVFYYSFLNDLSFYTDSGDMATVTIELLQILS